MKTIIERKTLQDVSLEVSVPPAIKSGLPVPITMTLINLSNQVFTYGEFGDFAECQMELVNKQSRVSPTAFGSRFFKDSTNTAQFAIMQLASGESVSWTQNFCDCFELDEGNYELSLSVQLKDPNGEIVFLKVNDLAFEIL